MHPILIFRHVECEGPGYFGAFLDARGIPWRLLRIDEGERVPASLDRVSGLVFMGGPMSVNDDLPWITGEIALIQRARERDMPILGHCLGGQLIGRALGAKISAGVAREIGWHQVRKLKGEGADRWLSGLPEILEVFHWHAECFALPRGASAILASPHCPCQAFVAGKTLAMQCHVEMTVALVQEWVRRFGEQLIPPSASVQSAADMLSDIDEKVARLQKLADSIYTTWWQGFSR